MSPLTDNIKNRLKKSLTRAQAESSPRRHPVALATPGAAFTNPFGAAELDTQQEQRIWERDRRLQAEQERQRQDQLQEECREREAAERAKIKEQRKQCASKETVRILRELIRNKYRLDILIWQNRRVQRADRELIFRDCHEADRMRRHILSIVKSWEEDMFDREEDWSMAKKIKNSLGREDEHAVWADIPPWNR
ncbi:uncharacterized protein LTR77_010847 [Saxophila tyrrhenica]|uniref:Uncharacterized protein n=1 Tax=Saxophila tyrrhenica TaxID=1690608 RepID=A0AAV9NY12_9PEZI|nr:hypothetical protein LTR77_010847 [Saxophila tyrrhenica]